MSIANMSGLEHMQAIVEGRIPHPSMCKTVSMEAISAEKGKVIYQAVALMIGILIHLEVYMADLQLRLWIQ